VDAYATSVAAGVAGFVTMLGGLDVLVFTGGVGENAAGLRRQAAEGLGFLGVAVDPSRDDTTDADISAPGAAVRTRVITAREDLEIAAGVRAVLRS
jgi:acetate kinase